MISRPKFLNREWINKKVLLYSTENYIQYPMINHNGKEYFKRMYICIMNHFAIWAVLSHSVMSNSL